LNDLRARFGSALKEWRLRRQLTQEQLAERAGLSYKFIGEVERGQGNPSLDTLISLAEALGVSLPDLFASLRRERASVDSDFRISRREVQMVREAAESLDAVMGNLTSQPQYKIKRKKRSSR